MRAQLPESHIVLVTPIALRERSIAYLEKGVYDLLYTPVASNTELLKKFDRAVERDYFMYVNERLEAAHAARQAAETSPPGVPTAQAITDDFHMNYVRSLFEQPNSQVQGVNRVQAEASTCTVEKRNVVLYR